MQAASWWSSGEWYPGRTLCDWRGSAEWWVGGLSATWATLSAIIAAYRICLPAYESHFWLPGVMLSTHMLLFHHFCSLSTVKLAYMYTCLSVCLPICMGKWSEQTWFLWNRGIPLYLSIVNRILWSIPITWQITKQSERLEVWERVRCKPKKYYYSYLHHCLVLQWPNLSVINQEGSQHLLPEPCLVDDIEGLLVQPNAPVWVKEGASELQRCVRQKYHTLTPHSAAWKGWNWWAHKFEPARAVIESITQCSWNSVCSGSVPFSWAGILELLSYSFKCLNTSKWSNATCSSTWGSHLTLKTWKLKEMRQLIVRLRAKRWFWSTEWHFLYQACKSHSLVHHLGLWHV